MIERRSVFFQEYYLFLLFYFFLSSLQVTELRPQHNEQFSQVQVPQYIPEYSTQFSVVPEDRGQQFSVDENARILNNFNNYNNNNGEEIRPPLAVDHHQKPRGKISYSSSLEEYESAGVEEHEDEAIPGEAQQDYPVYEEIPRTGFSCRGKYAPAYYADVEARCQVFHICDVGGYKHSFLCPNGSVFNQKYLVCDWWYDFTCDNAENLFNKQIVPTEINSVSPARPESFNNIESEKIFINNNEGLQPQIGQNDYNDYQNNNNNGIINNQEVIRTGFDFPNTQIDIPQQIFTDNVYIPQNDIFHGAETGFPGRDLINQNNVNFSNNSYNQNNITENSDKINNERNDNNYNAQQNKQNEENNNNKQALKTNNDINNQGNTNHNIYDNRNSKQQRINRKGNDFSPQFKNSGISANKEQVNFQNNNDDQAHFNRPAELKNNINNQNINYQQPYINGQTPTNNAQGSDLNHDPNKILAQSSLPPQFNFAPPL